MRVDANAYFCCMHGNLHVACFWKSVHAEFYYELTKDMTLGERRTFYHEKAMRFLNGESADEDAGSETDDVLKKDAS